MPFGQGLDRAARKACPPSYNAPPLQSETEPLTIVRRSRLAVMKHDAISTDEHRALLREELAVHHRRPAFRQCAGMGEILELQLATVLGL